MAVLATSGLTLPNHLAAGVWQKVTTGSTVGQLSGAEPMQFGTTNIFTFTTPPRAEYVAEAGSKSASSVAFGTKSITPHKVQTTIRVNEEVKWADEDYQLQVFSTIANAIATSLSRALDLGVYHAINPLTGGAATGISAKITDTTNAVEVATAADAELRTAAGLVIAQGYTPNAIALDPTYAWTIANAQYSDGRYKFENVGLGTNITSLYGLNAATSNTVSGRPEATDTKIRAIVGDFSQIRWGVQRSIPLTTIEYGDPDGQGDLKRQNQIAIRAEVVYGWAIMDVLAFTKINDLV